MTKADYSKENLEEIVSRSETWAEVLRALGLVPVGGNYRTVKRKVTEQGISTDHFLGNAWARGKTIETDARIVRSSTRKSDEEVFSRNSTYAPSGLARRLIQRGWEYVCSECGISEWRGKAIRLHVDHINGNRTDHRLENLRFLCPNCHSQTTTYTGHNISLTPLAESLKAQEEESRKCLDCGSPIVAGSTRCKSCATKESRGFKISWPDCASLRAMVEKEGYSSVGRRLGVSDNAIRKHLKCHCQ